MIEVLLGVERVPQPSPKRNPGGDCFACALVAAMRHLFPDQPISFDEAWETFLVESAGGIPHLSNSWHTMAHDVVWRLRERGYAIESRVDIIQPAFDLTYRSNSWWRFVPLHDWAYRLEAWLSAGWVALAETNFDGLGPVNPDGSHNYNDHFLVLDGQRHFWKRHATMPKASKLAHETHVVCSAKGSYWIDTELLLERHGVAGILLIRADVRTRR